MAIVEKSKSKSKPKAYLAEVKRRVSEKSKGALVPHAKRRSSQRYASYLYPKQSKGSSEIKYSRYGSETPKIWYVSNLARKTPRAGAVNPVTPMKIKVKAVTPRKAALFALKLKDWGTNRAYVGDGRGKNVILGFVREKNEETGRRTVRALARGAPYVPLSDDHEYLSSSEGSDEKMHDVHAPRTKRKYVKSGKYAGKSGKKSAHKASAPRRSARLAAK